MIEGSSGSTAPHAARSFPLIAAPSAPVQAVASRRAAPRCPPDQWENQSGTGLLNRRARGGSNNCLRWAATHCPRACTCIIHSAAAVSAHLQCLSGRVHIVEGGPHGYGHASRQARLEAARLQARVPTGHLGWLACTSSVHHVGEQTMMGEHQVSAAGVGTAGNHHV